MKNKDMSENMTTDFKGKAVPQKRVGGAILERRLPNDNGSLDYVVSVPAAPK